MPRHPSEPRRTRSNASVMIKVSDEEALLVDCPTCRQVARQGCVYVRPDSGLKRYGKKSQTTQDKLARLGKPTKRVHLRRREMAWQLRVRDTETRLPRLVARSRDGQEAARAMQTWDLIEMHALSLWLTEHGHLFTDLANSPAPRPKASYDPCWD